MLLVAFTNCWEASECPCMQLNGYYSIGQSRVLQREKGSVPAGPIVILLLSWEGEKKKKKKESEEGKKIRAYFQSDSIKGARNGRDPIKGVKIACRSSVRAMHSDDG